MIGDEYRQILGPDNNWHYVWYDLPLFADGEVAEYTLRESMIGDTAYDPAADNVDGYADYDVTYDKAKYREGDEGAYNDEPTWVDGQNVRHYANHVLLRSHNSLDNGLVDVNVTKQWRDGDDQDGLRPAAPSRSAPKITGAGYSESCAPMSTASALCILWPRSKSPAIPPASPAMLPPASTS